VPNQNNTPPYNSRAIAAEAIFAILESGKSLQEVLPKTLKKAKEQDKAWLHEMLYGVLRNLPTLQYWLRQLLNTPIKNQSRIVEHLLYLGLYQLHYSRVSDHAAVSETVAACQSLNQAHLKNLVNAILRNFIRNKVAEKEISEERIKLNLPKWYFKKLQQAYPENYCDIVQQQSSKPPIWLRVNRIHNSREQYCDALTAAKVQFIKDKNVDSALELINSQRIESLPGYEDGAFSVQDKAAQHAAFYLEAQPGDIVLDACAAPGGKYTHILEMQPDTGRCLALEIDGKRLSSIEDNAKRLGLKDIELIQGDATKPTDWNTENLKFDRILLDAPCSATGIIRRHPDILWLRKREDIEQLATLQSQILQQMWQQLKSGGVLLYATCSILPEENQQQIAEFLSQTPDAQHIPLNESDTPDSPGHQILPGEDGMDGFYYAKLQKQHS